MCERSYASFSVLAVIAFIDLVAPKRAVGLWGFGGLCSLAADPACKLDVLGHDGDSLGVDGAQVRVFKQTDEVRLAGLLKSHHGGALEAQVGLEVLSDLTDQALEGQLADQQLGGFLVATDLTESDSSRSVPVRFLHSTGGRRALSRCLGGELFSWSLSSGGFASGLLCTCHSERRIQRNESSESVMPGLTLLQILYVAR